MEFKIFKELWQKSIDIGCTSVHCPKENVIIIKEHSLTNLIDNCFKCKQNLINGGICDPI